MAMTMKDVKNDLILSNARKRYVKVTHDTRTLIPKDDIMLFLANEIDQYRDKIKLLEADIDYRASELKQEREANSDLRQKLLERERQYIELNKKVKQLEEKSTETTLEAVQENTVGEIIKALSDNGFNNISINAYKTKEE